MSGWTGPRVAAVEDAAEGGWRVVAAWPSSWGAGSWARMRVPVPALDGPAALLWASANLQIARALRSARRQARIESAHSVGDEQQ